jgi:hypothetical protein
MSVDRTREFLALVDAAAAAMGAQRPGGGGAQALNARPHHPSAATRPLVPPSSATQGGGPTPTYESRSAFLGAVREVSSDLNRTSLKLSALTKRALTRGPVVGPRQAAGDRVRAAPAASLSLSHRRSPLALTRTRPRGPHATLSNHTTPAHRSRQEARHV